MENKNILITGGTGSLAKGLVEKLLGQQVAHIKLIARSEEQIVALKHYYASNKRVEPLIGDIRDKGRMSEIMTGCDIVFHLAALKHVTICELMPTEAVSTNIIGTQNIIDCARINQVEKVIYISTDKAVKPNCAYGSTKLIGEKLMLAAHETSRTKFSVFRCGNLFASSGSVIPVFEQQIEHTGRVKVTDKGMNRFFIDIKEAADRIIDVAIRADGGEIFLPRMEALRIYDIAKYMLQKNGIDESKIEYMGIRPGEKISEDMVTEEEAKHIYKINKELYVVINNAENSWIRNKFIKKDTSYAVCSEDVIVNYEKASEFIRKAYC